MPVHSCQKDGKNGHKWGKSGKCYTGSDSKKKASAQAQAIYASGWREGHKPSFLTWLTETMIPNPLGTPPSNIGDMMDEFSDIESGFAELMFSNVPSPQRYVMGMKELRGNGSIQNISIDKLIPLEPELDQDHINNINAGEPVKMSGGTHPLVYRYNGKYYINDGNHRVAAAKIRGETSIPVLVVDLSVIANMIAKHK